MFSSNNQSYYKLKTNLRVCGQRLKLLQKKKAEIALKQRKEIANFIVEGKIERAKIRVEHIIREDYLVEAMEIVELYCDLLLARFGLIEKMKTLDDGIAEAISSIIWIAPRLLSEVGELKVISNQLTAKYGKPYTKACQENSVGTVSEKLIAKLSISAPPKLTVEKYLVEIAKYYNVEYEPDHLVMQSDETIVPNSLIDISSLPAQSSSPFTYPTPIQPMRQSTSINSAWTSPLMSSTIPKLALLIQATCLHLIVQLPVMHLQVGCLKSQIYRISPRKKKLLQILTKVL